MISNSICSGKVLYEIYVPAYGLSWWTCHVHLKNRYVLQFLCTIFCKCQLCEDGSIFETCVLIDSCLLGILINVKDVKNLWLLDLCLWICLFFPLVCQYLFHEFDPLLVDRYIVMYSWWIVCLHTCFGIESSHSAFLCSFCQVYHLLCFFCLCFYILIVSYRRYLTVRSCFLLGCLVCLREV